MDVCRPLIPAVAGMSSSSRKYSIERVLFPDLTQVSQFWLHSIAGRWLDLLLLVAN